MPVPRIVGIEIRPRAPRSSAVFIGRTLQTIAAAQAGGDTVVAENSREWRRQARLAGLPVELVPMIGTLPLATLFDAAARAERIGVGGDEVLVAAGVVGRDAYTRRLAAWLGLRFAELDGTDEQAGDAVPIRRRWRRDSWRSGAPLAA